MSNTTVVLYHANCADGFGAAWAAWRKLGENAVYVPVQYGKPYPSEIDGGVREVYILDFSYPADVLERLSASLNCLVILDHHKTAAAELAKFKGPNIGAKYGIWFNQEKSGAVMAWEYFHPGEPVPRLLEYVQDRDLWTWKLPLSKEVSAALATYPHDFRKWSCLLHAAEDGSLAREGASVLRFQAQQVERHVARAALRAFRGYPGVPVVNATTLMSEIGEALCAKYPDAPFAATYFITEKGERVWSLRSRNGFDVGAVAQSRGGGGHQAAAGFTEPPP